jgi:hypothetical protein
MRLAGGARTHWRPLLAVVLITAGVMLRSSTWGVLLFAGLWFLLYAFLIPASRDRDRKLRRQLRSATHWWWRRYLARSRKRRCGAGRESPALARA